MAQLKSLNQRMALYILFPVSILLVGMGFAGFLFARNSLLQQWGEATTLKLQRAAHHVDMRLSAPKELMKIFHKASEYVNAHHIQIAIIEQLKEIDSVAGVNLTWTDGHAGFEYRADKNTRQTGLNYSKPMHSGGAMMSFHHAGPLRVTPPVYDSRIENETVSLILNLQSKDEDHTGKLEVMLRFEDLINIDNSVWRGNQKTFLVDNDGKVLTGTSQNKRKQLGENNSQLEIQALKALNANHFGTLFEKGHPPSKVIGFYRLNEAPWTLVVMARGQDILAPITSFRFYYVLTSFVFILIIIMVIRLVTGLTVSSIKDISKAAQRIARGQFSSHLPVKTQDEVGELTKGFNTMMTQLQERMKLKTELNLAMEVQQSLLPNSDPLYEGLDIAGESIYCDETGGDYYDYLPLGNNNDHKIGVVVGDVSGHGIHSALLMATARASLRQRSVSSERIDDIISDVNEQLVNDVEDSGHFMTMFFLSIDVKEQSLEWVRAGHDPAIIYDPTTDEFQELKGKGTALGLQKEWNYETQARNNFSNGQIILIGTDGVWEARNKNGDFFGKNRVHEIVRKENKSSARDIVSTIVFELNRFQSGITREDDITLVVIKSKMNKNRKENDLQV